MWTSRCWNTITVGASRSPTITAAVFIQWRLSHCLSLLLLTLLAGEMVTPVHGGLADFSAPGIIQYGTCAQPKEHVSFRFDEFDGLWYQVEMVANNYMEAKKCITLDFRWNGVEYNVTTLGLDEYNEMVSQDATITLVEPENPASMKPYLQIWAPGGGGPEQQDEKEEEEEENALAALTSEEVNQHQPPNRASTPRSELVTGEEETMIEELEDLLEEIQGGGGGRGEALASFQPRNGSVGDSTRDLNEESEVGSVKHPTSHHTPDKGRRRRPAEGEQQRRKGQVSEGVKDDSLELYIDDPSLDVIYHETANGRGGGDTEGEHDEKGEGLAVMTRGSESQGSGGDGSVPASAPLLLLALLGLVLWPRVSFRP
ncbi:uncharacterized protein LOC123511615 isoform X2 [Portunus trituberculatus]|uniref:uncharacterized protein LOC123511615 isoform X2 n=1 Tax=Portunus trituberculatus TaxID=210409 RepID=UPI001E1D1D22|nr:uncharacterized protein LOC123511615 isoform X2 [Portunus trituberculatus]